MPDLRARLKAVAARAQAPEVPPAHLAIETHTPLCEMPGLLDARSVCRLGLDDKGWDVRKALFLDTETTGLRGAGTVAFLVGLGWIEGDMFVVRQLLMRDYPEEAPLLEEVATYLSRFTYLVSFNGKSFDAPLLRDRFVMARLRDRWRDLVHLDLLHAARRTWRLRLGACNLGALEEALLGVHRVDDLPGAQVPERFFRYLKTGDMALLDDVLRHNEQDIRSLGLLLGKLCAVYDAPHAQESLLDVLSAGRALDRYGEGELARRCFRVASVGELSRQARLQLARSYRREKDYAQAVQAYHEMIACGEAAPEQYEALAVILERYVQNAREALDVVDQALFRFSGGLADDAVIESLYRRRKRLRAKIQNADETRRT